MGLAGSGLAPDGGQSALPRRPQRRLLLEPVLHGLAVPGPGHRAGPARAAPELARQGRPGLEYVHRDAQRRLEPAPRAARHRHGHAGLKRVQRPAVRPLVQRDARRHGCRPAYAHRGRRVPARPARRCRHLVRPRGLPRHRRGSHGRVRRSPRAADLERDVRPDGGSSGRPLHRVRHQRLVRLGRPVGRLRRDDSEARRPLPADRLARRARQPNGRLRSARKLPAICFGPGGRQLHDGQ